MIRTSKLNLPIYNDPINDTFNIVDWNESNITIDNIYSSLVDIRKDIETVNADAEIILARKGETTLGNKIDSIDSDILQLKSFLDYMPVNGGSFEDIDGNSGTSVALDGGTF